MTKKHKRRKGRVGGSHEIATPILTERAQEALDAQRWRDAITAYKELSKREDRADWRLRLADAYAGRAGELTEKGMLKEALAIWENRAALDPQLPLAPGHAALLVRLDRLDAAVALLAEDGDGALPREQREQIRAQLAARILGGDDAMLERLPDDDPIRRHAAPALTALAGYCDGDDEAVRAALAEIPFRSPYRDWAQILKALLLQPTAPAEAKALLDRIDDDSGFAPLRRAAILSLLPEHEFLGAAATAKPAEHRVAAVLRGWPSERIAVWQALHALGDDPPPKALICLLHQHQRVLGADWVRRKSLSLIASDRSPESIHWLRECGGKAPNHFEQALLTAWRTDTNRDPWLLLERWRDCAAFLEPQWHQRKDPDLALRIALLLRHADAQGNMLGPPAQPSGHPEEFDTIAAEYLEASLSWDPDDQATYLRLIHFYRRGRQLKNARRLLEQAQERWPRDMGVLEAAMDIALDARSFKKAAGLARRILDIDPINSGVRRRLVNAHLAHARKQQTKGRGDLARKELAEAASWARDTTISKRIALMTALLSIVDGDPDGVRALRDQFQGQDIALADRLELALAADAIGLWLGTVDNQLKLKKPKARDRDDLAATMTRLRSARDDDLNLSDATLKMLEAALTSRTPWDQLSRVELEAACETLARHELDRARQQAANAGRKRWRNEPIFELHRFEAKYPDGFDYRSMKDLWGLEAALDRARANGEMRTAIRIEEALPAFGPRGGLGGGPIPVPSLPPIFADDSAEDDDEGLPPDIVDIIRTIGIKRALEIFGAPPELIRSVKEIERMMGPDAATDMLLDLLGDGSTPNPFEDLPFPP